MYLASWNSSCFFVAIRFGNRMVRADRAASHVSSPTVHFHFALTVHIQFATRRKVVSACTSQTTLYIYLSHFLPVYSPSLQILFLYSQKKKKKHSTFPYHFHALFCNFKIFISNIINTWAVLSITVLQMWFNIRVSNIANELMCYYT